MPEEKIDAGVVVETPKDSNSNVAPTENKEAEEKKEDIDPRIVGIIGEEKIQSAFGDKPKEDVVKTDDGKEEEKKPSEKLNEDGEDKKEDGQEVEVPNITPPDPKPSRLDRRLANRYIHNLHLMGIKKIPTEEEVISSLKTISKEEKVQALKFHLQNEKRILGENPKKATFEQEDVEAIQDADKEAIRNEILAEENEKKVLKGFVEFIDGHPEIDEAKPEFNPKLSKAVETLWRGGMSVDEAFETVTSEIQAVKEAQIAEEKKEKDVALSGVLSGTGQIPREVKDLSWEDVARIKEEDPQLYRRMVAEGKFKHLM